MPDKASIGLKNGAVNTSCTLLKNGKKLCISTVKYRTTDAFTSPKGAVPPFSDYHVSVFPNKLYLLEAGIVHIGCDVFDSGYFQVLTPPQYGSLSITTISQPIPECTENVPWAAAGYTWTSQLSGPLVDLVTLQYINAMEPGYIDITSFIPSVAYVKIRSVDLMSSSSKLTLDLYGEIGSGPLELTFKGETDAPKIVVPGAYTGLSSQGAVAYDVPINRTNIPRGIYSSLQVKWTPSTAPSPIVGIFTPTTPWNVSGLIQYTQYNTPKESACTGALAPKWVVDSLTSCNYTQVNLKSDFASQISINGTGSSNNLGLLKAASATALNNGACSATRPPGATLDATYLQVSSVVGSCNVPLVPGTSVAVWPKICNSTYILVNSANANFTNKVSSDTCPACRKHSTGTVGHMDSYTSVNLCTGSGVGDLGNFWTIKF